MNREVIPRALALLEAMPSTQPWGEPQAELYQYVLKRFSEDLIPQVLERIVLHEHWRPPPARIIEIALDMIAPIPSAEECYAEIQSELFAKGWYGTPEFSHAIVWKIVHALGGWRAICSSEANRQGGLYGQCIKMHKSFALRWRADAEVLLSLPADERAHALRGLERDTLRLLTSGEGNRASVAPRT